jgi:hypothetical protein
LKSPLSGRSPRPGCSRQRLLISGIRSTRSPAKRTLSRRPKLSAAQEIDAGSALEEIVDSELTLAEMLAAKQLAKYPASVNALLAMTMVDGLRADYAALIERKDGASLSYTKKGRRSAERLLMANSSCYDAYLALGVENYILGTKAAPLRWL